MIINVALSGDNYVLLLSRGNIPINAPLDTDEAKALVTDLLVAIDQANKLQNDYDMTQIEARKVSLTAQIASLQKNLDVLNKI